MEITKRRPGGKTTVSSMKGVRFFGAGHKVSDTPTAGFTLAEMEADQCRWPITHNKPHGFCGDKKKQGKSYCEAHYLRSLEPEPTPVE